MKLPKSFFKIMIILVFVAAIPIMMIGANFFILKSEHLLHNCLQVKNYFKYSLPCNEISVSALESWISFLGFLIMLTTIYGLYLINDRFRNKF